MIAQEGRTLADNLAELRMIEAERMAQKAASLNSFDRRRRSPSWPGGAPNSRRYSRLNCEGLSYPTAKPTAAMSFGLAARRARACCSRICFWRSEEHTSELQS